MRKGHVCEKCGKGYQKGHLVSHAKNRHLKRFYPNIHPAWVIESGSVVRRRLCVKCLRRAVRAKKTNLKTTASKPLAFAAG